MYYTLHILRFIVTDCQIFRKSVLYRVRSVDQLPVSFHGQILSDMI